MNPKVSLVKCESYDLQEVSLALKRALDLLGGISAFIRPKSRVLLKPNLLMAIGPESGVITHPAVVRAAIKLLREIDLVSFSVTGRAYGGRIAENVGEVYEKTGIKQLAREEGVELVTFDKRRWRGKLPLAGTLLVV